MRSIRIYFLMILFIISFSCISINYKQISVPQEGGIRFIKITESEDRVLPPNIQTEFLKINYVPKNIFCISTDGNKLAYISYKENKSNIFIKQINQSIMAKIQRTFRVDVRDVAISPDGKILAFSDFKAGNWNIYSTSAESGSAVRQITTSPLNEFSPIFSPIGSTLLFVQYETQIIESKTFYQSYIWTYDLEKSILTQYSTGNNPSFAPDGKIVSVTRPNQITGYGEIWLLDLEKGQESLVLASDKKGFPESVISPDGQKIAFVTKTITKGINNNLDIYIITISGTNLTQLTYHQGHDICPRWSPDGKAIYFISQRGSERGEYNIWRMDIENAITF